MAASELGLAMTGEWIFDAELWSSCVAVSETVWREGAELWSSCSMTASETGWREWIFDAEFWSSCVAVSETSWREGAELWSSCSMTASETGWRGGIFGDEFWSSCSMAASEIVVEGFCVEESDSGYSPIEESESGYSPGTMDASETGWAKIGDEDIGFGVGVPAIDHSAARGCMEIGGLCSCCKCRGTYRCAAEANVLADVSWLGVFWFMRRYGKKLKREAAGGGILDVAGERFGLSSLSRWYDEKLKIDVGTLGMVAVLVLVRLSCTLNLLLFYCILNFT
jgi:hypothetical protein